VISGENRTCRNFRSGAQGKAARRNECGGSGYAMAAIRFLMGAALLPVGGQMVPRKIVYFLVGLL